MSAMADRVAANLAAVRGRMAEAARRSGRAVEAVRLIAVTKYVGAAEIRALVEAGGRDLGESRPQQLWQRADALRDLPIRWHMVGHLQRNKVRRTLALAALIHSVDTPQLLETLERVAGETGATASVLLEVNIAGEASKNGLAPDAVAPLLASASEYPHVQIRGLMGMAALEGGVDAARRDFVRLRTLRDRVQTSLPPGVSLDELSMGMSGDFEAAIEEGATLVRVGSALFEGLGS